MRCRGFSPRQLRPCVWAQLARGCARLPLALAADPLRLSAEGAQPTLHDLWRSSSRGGSDHGISLPGRFPFRPSFVGLGGSPLRQGRTGPRWFRARPTTRPRAPSIGSARDLATAVGSSSARSQTCVREPRHPFTCCRPPAAVRRTRAPTSRYPADIEDAPGPRLRATRERPRTRPGKMLLTDFCNRLVDTCTCS